MQKQLSFKSVAIFLLSVTIVSSVSSQPATKSIPLKFDFGSGETASSFTGVHPGDLFSEDKGYGFEQGAVIEEFKHGKDALTGDFVTAGNGGFMFSVAVPEGNYKVVVTLGDATGKSQTTVRAEARRLILERVMTKDKEIVQKSFIVNTRTPALSPGNTMKLDSREWNAQTNKAITLTWDDKLTLQFMDERPCVCAIELEKVEDAITIFVIGNSTVTDQVGNGTGTWAQMLSRWFQMPVVVANHAESGQTMKGFRFSRRWDKVVESIKPGDYVLMAFGHNDSKSSGHDGMWPADDKAGEWIITHSDANTDFKWMMATNAVEVKRRGGIPVILSPITRISRQTGETNEAAHGDYPKAAREAAEMADCAFIDLTAMSVEVMKGLGPEVTLSSYTDATHTTLYGGYLLSRCVVEGLKQANLDIVKYLTEDAGTFDPKNPLPKPADFQVPSDARNVRSSFQGPQ